VRADLKKIAGIDVLNKTLGPVLAFRFLTLFRRKPTDYVEISRRLYEGQTIDELFGNYLPKNRFIKTTKDTKAAQRARRIIFYPFVSFVSTLCPLW
jgi:hypothetical protein